MLLKRPAYLKNYFFSYLLLLSLPAVPFLQNSKITWIVHATLLLFIIIEKRAISFSKYPLLVLLTLIPVLWSFLLTLEGEYYYITQSLFYLLTPYLMIILGIQFGGLLKSQEDLYRYIVYSGTLGAIIYIVRGIIFLGESAFNDIYNFKTTMTWSSITNVLAIVLLLFSERFNIYITKKRFVKILLLVVNFVGLLTTASRTYYLILLIFILVILYSYRKATFTFFGILLAALFMFILSVESDNVMIMKIQNSYEEISNTREFSGYDDVNAFYRAYETQKAMNTYNSGTEAQLLLGHGLQKLVDLDIYVELAGEYRRFIPVLHNGYAYLLLRTGVLGFLIFFIFFARSFTLRDVTKRSNFFHLLYMGVLISLVISNYVVSTFYTTEMTFSWMFIGIYFLLSTKKLETEVEA